MNHLINEKIKEFEKKFTLPRWLGGKRFDDSWGNYIEPKAVEAWLKRTLRDVVEKRDGEIIKKIKDKVGDDKNKEWINSRYDCCGCSTYQEIYEDCLSVLNSTDTTE